MEFEERLKDHYKRWNIEYSQEEQFVNFKNRLIDIVNTQLGDYLALNSDIDWSFGEKYDRHEADKPYVKKSHEILKPTPNQVELQKLVLNRPDLVPKYEFTEKGFGDTRVYQSLDSCKSSKELATAIQILFWVLEERYDEISDLVSKIVEGIKRVSLLTPSIGFAINQNAKQVTIYPYGEKFLDEGVINVVLSGLEKYPEVLKRFTKALQIYQSGETSQYRYLLDELRLSLEQFLKNIVGNNERLENQPKEKKKGREPRLKDWFKDKGIHDEVRQLYEELLKKFTNYQNDAVKHGEAFSEQEVEFMIYLTGNFMRLLLQIQEKDNDN